MKQKHSGNSYKKVPSYWWDFQWNDSNTKIEKIIVESDHKNWHLLGEIYLFQNEDADKEISFANRIIEELKSGRLSHKECYKRHVEGFVGIFLDDIGYNE